MSTEAERLLHVMMRHRQGHRCKRTNGSMLYILLDDEIRVVNVPQLAESLSEGDIRWEKGVVLMMIDLII